MTSILLLLFRIIKSLRVMNHLRTRSAGIKLSLSMDMQGCVLIILKMRSSRLNGGCITQSHPPGACFAGFPVRPAHSVPGEIRDRIGIIENANERKFTVVRSVSLRD